ncbi:hypothetical protein DM860_011701 [Cuscuta australis]|uniref:Uncharacterized protein n=1 Tax=Cuscuta australis TaxID=267555 RepID=A0A328DFX5_9ASTE|nr:hypothetical protein DM860_011701 [Cuscuta australis]
MLACAGCDSAFLNICAQVLSNHRCRGQRSSMIYLPFAPNLFDNIPERDFLKKLIDCSSLSLFVESRLLPP